MIQGEYKEEKGETEISIAQPLEIQEKGKH